MVHSSFLSPFAFAHSIWMKKASREFLLTVINSSIRHVVSCSGIIGSDAHTVWFVFVDWFVYCVFLLFVVWVEHELKSKQKNTNNGEYEFSCARCVVGPIRADALRIECISIERFENTGHRMLRWTNLFMVCRSELTSDWLQGHGH